MRGVKIDARGSNVFKQHRGCGPGRFIRGYQQAISRAAEWFVKAIYELVCKQTAVPVCSRLRVGHRRAFALQTRINVGSAA